jgi:hypothetical protein
MNREELADTLAGMSVNEMYALRLAGANKRAREKAAREAARLPDEAGTVRYDKDKDVFLVRCVMTAEEHISGEEWAYWETYEREGHGEGTLEDTDIDARQCPVIAQVVTRWME